MLTRPEIGTPEHITLWLASKPSNESYTWESADHCACGQYAREHGLGKTNRGGKENDWLDDGECHHWSLRLNALAREYPHTFGALYLRYLEVWPPPDLKHEYHQILSRLGLHSVSSSRHPETT